MFNRIFSTVRESDVIDIHVHIAGPPDENDAMYYWSKSFEKTVSFDGIKLVTKLTRSQMTATRYVSVLFSQLKNSKHVDKAVLLALDQAYSEEGNPERDRTHLFVSNAYLAHLSQMYPNFLFGCSVHPYSPDALLRLWNCVKNGAVLNKWLCSSQSIDPTHPLSVKFYLALAELRLPLLLHVGPEATIPSGMAKAEERSVNAATGKYGPQVGDALSMAMDAGVRVIMAHCGTPLGALFAQENEYWESVFDRIFKYLEAEDRKQCLFADVSAFCLPGRFKYVQRILPLAKDKPWRFLYGSDYPIPIVSLNENKALEDILKAFGWLAGRALPGNDFDKNFQLLKPHFPDQTFTAAAKVLRDPQKPPPRLDTYLKRLGVKKRRFFWFLKKKNNSIPPGDL
jgi:predicted TIM-barrel fold metal-dependent hydrolase